MCCNGQHGRPRVAVLARIRNTVVQSRLFGPEALPFKYVLWLDADVVQRHCPPTSS